MLTAFNNSVKVRGTINCNDVVDSLQTIPLCRELKLNAIVENNYDSEEVIWSSDNPAVDVQNGIVYAKDLCDETVIVKASIGDEVSATVKVKVAWTFKDVNSERGTETFIKFLGFNKSDFIVQYQSSVAASSLFLPNSVKVFINIL